MRKVFLALMFGIGLATLGGCGPERPTNDPPPPPQDSGADKNKKALFPIPEDKGPDQKNDKESETKKEKESEPKK